MDEISDPSYRAQPATLALLPDGSIVRIARGRTVGEFYGDFMLDGDAGSSRELQDRSLGEAIEAKRRRTPVEGDSVLLARLQFTVRSMEGPRVTGVGMKLSRRQA